MNRVLFVVAVVVTCFAMVCGLMLRHTRGELRRLEQNVESLMGDVEHYKTRAEKSAASVAILELKIEEFKRMQSRDAEQIRSLGIRLRRTESFAKSVTATTSSLSIALRDSIAGRDTVKIFDTTQGGTTLSGRVASDSLSISIKQRDTLYQVVHRVPRKFLFLRFGTKAIHQDVWTSNPLSEVVYTEYIELSKREKTKRQRGRRREK
ncbi:MAG: hypothetical protein J6R50_00530 [Alistipes sp.]|nr:hypothetical protein [Alistipes sp.]